MSQIRKEDNSSILRSNISHKSNTSSILASNLSKSKMSFYQ